MFEYAKMVFNEKIKEEKEILEKTEKEKDDIDRKLSDIVKYDDLCKKIRKLKINIFIFAVLWFLLVICFLILISMTTQLDLINIVLALSASSLVLAVAISDDIISLIDSLKEYKKISFTEIEELKKNEENMKQISKELKDKISNYKDFIRKYKEELKKLSLMDEYQDYIKQPFYQADTEEEYKSLMSEQENLEDNVKLEHDSGIICLTKK